MTRSLALLTAVVCYAVFLAAFLYLIGFVAGLDALPRHVDKGASAPPMIAALARGGTTRLS
jgi:hypothetical protein